MAHVCELCIKDILKSKSSLPFLVAQEARISTLLKIFGSGKRKKILKKECERAKVKFYRVLKASATRWGASRLASYRNLVRTFPQQTELKVNQRRVVKFSMPFFRVWQLVTTEVGYSKNSFFH